MNLVFSQQAWEDYLHWQATNPKIAARINLLLKDVIRSPHAGIGKPESLKHNYRGY